MTDVTYRKLTPTYQETVYEVVLDGQVVGKVYSVKHESWRKLPSGVRYSMRGTPTEWGFVTDSGKYGPAHYDRRSDATAALLRARNT